MAQINEVNKAPPINPNILSPISETDSNKYQTIDSNGQTIKRINPDEERKLTGTGSYRIKDETEEEHENDYYSDDFESDEDDEESSSSIFTDGCSGTTVDTTSRSQAAASTRADQAQELERVVEAYNMILENTVTDEDFNQYKPSFDSSAVDSLNMNRDAGGPQNSRDQEPRSLAHSESQPIKPMSHRLEG